MAEADRYQVLEKIGHGSFGVIRKVKRKSDGYILCRKEISYMKMSQKEREQLAAELQILKGLRHPNIVQYYEREHIKASSDLHIYMEYCEQGDLGRYIKDLKRSGRLADEDFVWSIFAQLITALYRCHYGEDPPDVSRNVIGTTSDAKPLKSKVSREMMILHRDLKPENIFLGADASVKLGDFGLSKLMASNDFASTYVGTPFYMSPEICGAEQYSLHSDIWAFGCIMYELCSKEPPFNAKTHLELIQKIKLGRVAPLSPTYSPELREAISRCMRVNPSTRPDTAQLLNLPTVKVKRKEVELVAQTRFYKEWDERLVRREELISRREKELERKAAELNTAKEAARNEVDSQLRREWEVKARLEIDKLVKVERDHLRREFEVEVNRRISDALDSQQAELSHAQAVVRSSTPDPADLPALSAATSYHQSHSTTEETDDFPSSTDLSELSLESPTATRPKGPKKSARTPFARAQTMFDGSPADVAMVDPSPAPIASLNLSPRRDKANPVPMSRNIFAAAAVGASPPHSDAEPDDYEDDEDGDEVPNIPSPTRAKHNGDPFKAMGSMRRPGMLRQKTAPQKPVAQSHIMTNGSRFPMRETSHSNLAGPGHHPKAAIMSTSPSRHASKLPAAAARSTSPHRRAADGTTSPQRRPPSRKDLEQVDARHVTASSKQVQGRTLVELAQAKVSGGSGVAVYDFGNDKANEPAGRTSLSMAGKEDVRPRSDVTVWDPERDEMPSPFLAKKSRGMLPGAIGGPGLKHLR